MTVIECLPPSEYDWTRVVGDRLAAFDFGQGTESAGSAVVGTHDIADLLVTDWTCPPLEGRRSTSMVDRQPEAVMLFIATSGFQVMKMSHHSVVLRPEEILLLSSRFTGGLTIPKGIRKRSVRIPLPALLPFHVGHDLPPLLHLSTAQHPLAALTHNYLLGLDQLSSLMSPGEIESARTALLALTAGMIRGATQTSESEFLPALRRQMEAWIVDHLSDGVVRVAELAAAHNVATRTVHRAFAHTGDTVGSVVRAYRVAAARDDLIETKLSIAAIAHRWGFCDASHLGREFRGQFSMSPSEYRDTFAVG